MGHHIKGSVGEKQAKHLLIITNSKTIGSSFVIHVLRMEDEEMMGEDKIYELASYGIGSILVFHINNDGFGFY